MVPPGYAPVWEDTLTANMLEKWTQAQFHREKDHWFFQHAGIPPTGGVTNMLVP